MFSSVRALTSPWGRRSEIFLWPKNQVMSEHISKKKKKKITFQPQYFVRRRPQPLPGVRLLTYTNAKKSRSLSIGSMRNETPSCASLALHLITYVGFPYHAHVCIILTYHIQCDSRQTLDRPSSRRSGMSTSGLLNPSCAPID